MVSLHAVCGHGDIAKTDEIVRGRVFADYDSEGNLLGVEVLQVESVSLHELWGTIDSDDGHD